MRHAVFRLLNFRARHTAARARHHMGSWVVPVGVSLGIVAVMGLVMMAIAIAEFRKTE